MAARSVTVVASGGHPFIFDGPRNQTILLSPFVITKTDAAHCEANPRPGRASRATDVLNFLPDVLCRPLAVDVANLKTERTHP
ncbi:hypothetical protein [Paraburkholderia mimosarum]|uniref:hypothetical protein n=1 Tax=Paraburkholderia mimosarum TaxID=312026 RepID=UPI000411543A|nr:hypothetical protein [Paraburkholderia mimosarum]